jgi:thymidylate synthase
MPEYELDSEGYCINNPGEQQYLDTLEDVLFNGVESGDRTGVGTYRLFSQSMVFNIESGKVEINNNRYQIPILTTKYVWHRAIWTELCWFLKGDTNIEYLKDNGVDIWDEWADDNGELGPVYGRQLRSFPTPDGDTVDQLENVCVNIEDNPYSRRHVLTMWNPGELDDMRLAPCHGTAIQLHVEPSEDDFKEDKLSMSMYQRSGDLFLGVPFNITSYCALLTLIAIRTGLRPNKFYYTIGDAHIYKNHTEQVMKQIRQDYQPYPLTKIQPRLGFEDYEPEDFQVMNYHHGPKIKAPVAV